MWRVSAYTAGILIVVGLVTLMFARRAALPRTPDWKRRAGMWLVLAAALGAFLASLALIVIRIIEFRVDLATAPANVLGGSIAAGAMMLMFYALVVGGMFVPSYATVVVLTARFGPLLGKLETTWSGLILLTALMAAPAGLATAVFASTWWSPSGYSNAALIHISAYIFLIAWIALLSARRVTARLSPGVFAA